MKGWVGNDASSPNGMANFTKACEERVETGGIPDQRQHFFCEIGTLAFITPCQAASDNFCK